MLNGIIKHRYYVSQVAAKCNPSSGYFIEMKKQEKDSLFYALLNVQAKMRDLKKVVSKEVFEAVGNITIK